MNLNNKKSNNKEPEYTKPPQRILHITTSLATGGAEMMLLKLIRSTQCQNTSHYVLQLARDTGPIRDRLTELNIPVFSLDLDRKFSDLNRLLGIKPILRSVNPTVVQGWLHHSNAIASLTKFLRWHSGDIIWGIRHTLYNDMPLSLRTRLALWGCQVILRRVKQARPKHIVYNSLVSAYQHEKRGFPGSCRVLIPNGFLISKGLNRRLEIREKYGIQENEHLFAIVARYHLMKGHKNVLAAFRLLVEEGKNVKLIIAGRGCDDIASELPQLINQLNICEQVVTCGEVESSSEILEAADTLVVGSIYGEGIPNIIGEAMMCGKVVVATDVGDSRLLLGNLGYIVPRHSPDMMYYGMRSACELPENERRRLAPLLQARIQARFDIASVAELFTSLY